jgi:DNA-directed RNA polymerase
MLERFIDEVFYIPWSYDWRGRVYPIPTFMSPQGSDMEKSLYLFNVSRPITEDAKRWLAIHVANCAGHDKLSLDDRVKWVAENVSLISSIAQDPIRAIPLYMEWDSPWCGVAACSEYYNCVITGEQKTTSLPVATDATCSGLQHLSAMTLDGQTGRLVNVSPTPKPQDAYKAVLKKTLEILRERDQHDLADWAEACGRPIAKRVVMTVPYAAEFQSNKGYIKQALDEYEEDREKKGFERRYPKAAELKIITKAMLDAMRVVVPGPIKVMEWIKTAAREYFKDETNPEEITWRTHAGFHVIQDKREANQVRVRTRLLGDVISTRCAEGYKGPKVSKHVSGTAPNWIHSLDSCLLMESFAGFEHPFSLIHDSILTTASDMGYMSQVIREQFVEIYKEMPLHQLAEVLNTEVPSELIKGDLDLDSCNESTYFFC